MKKIVKSLVDHDANTFGVFSLIFRVVIYAIGMLGSMWMSATWLHDTYMANMSLFIVFAFTFELLWNRSHEGPRLWFYVACVLALALAGVMLVKQAALVSQCNAQVQSGCIHDIR